MTDVPEDYDQPAICGYYDPDKGTYCVGIGAQEESGACECTFENSKPFVSDYGTWCACDWEGGFEPSDDFFSCELVDIG